jgi:uncharacterized protein YcbX
MFRTRATFRAELHRIAYGRYRGFEGRSNQGNRRVWIKEIWRYPVKSMAGESLMSTDLSDSGLEGDRILQVRNSGGRIMTARTRPLLLRHRATLTDANEVLVDGRPWMKDEVSREVEAAAGAGTRLVPSDPENRFDILPLLIATDGMLTAVGHDSRRFRPNLIISGVAGLDERKWEGGRLRIGSVVIGIEDLRTRCIMTTFDPDSGEQNLDVLRRVQKEFNGKLGLNSYVIEPGHVSVGDAVEVMPAS